MAVTAGAAAEVVAVAGNLSPKLPWELANPKWAATLNPVIQNPLVDGRFLSTVLATGNNVLNHGLGRKLQGYLVILKSANVDIYDAQSSNQRTDLTLILNSSGAATISLYVF